MTKPKSGKILIVFSLSPDYMLRRDGVVTVAAASEHNHLVSAIRTSLFVTKAI